MSVESLEHFCQAHDSENREAQLKLTFLAIQRTFDLNFSYLLRPISTVFTNVVRSLYSIPTAVGSPQSAVCILYLVRVLYPVRLFQSVQEGGGDSIVFELRLLNHRFPWRRPLPPESVFYTQSVFYIQSAVRSLYFILTAILMSRGVNLGNQKELYFQNRKRYHVENFLRSLFLRDLFLDGDKTLKFPAILEFTFL